MADGFALVAPVKLVRVKVAAEYPVKVASVKSPAALVTEIEGLTAEYNLSVKFSGVAADRLKALSKIFCLPVSTKVADMKTPLNVL